MDRMTNKVEDERELPAIATVTVDTVLRYVNEARAQASIDNDLHVTHHRSHPTLGELMTRFLDLTCDSAGEQATILGLHIMTGNPQHPGVPTSDTYSETRFLIVASMILRILSRS